MILYLIPKQTLLSELTLSQAQNGVHIAVVCPETAIWCQLRRLDTFHVVYETDETSFTTIDTDVQSGATYAYEARYFISGVEESQYPINDTITLS